jgi:hypothetical protein
MTTSLWKLPQPWTPRTRPPLLGKPQNGFPRAPTGSHRFSFGGDISISLRTGTFLFRVDKLRGELLTPSDRAGNIESRARLS